MKGRKRHGGRRANRGTPVNRLAAGQPSIARDIVRKMRRRFGATWYTGEHYIAPVDGATCTARELYDCHAVAGDRRLRAITDAFIVDFGDLLDNLTPEQEHRIRCDMRYDREIAAAYRRNMPDTAAAIEAERAEWLATLDATGND